MIKSKPEAPIDKDKLDTFAFEYLSGKRFSWAVTVNRVKHLKQEMLERKLVPCKLCPKYNTFITYHIVKCKLVWVAIGTNVNGDKYEIAMALDKNELGIWCDLHVKPELMS